MEIASRSKKLKKSSGNPEERKGEGSDPQNTRLTWSNSLCEGRDGSSRRSWALARIAAGERERRGAFYFILHIPRVRARALMRCSEIKSDGPSLLLSRRGDEPIGANASVYPDPRYRSESSCKFWITKLQLLANALESTRSVASNVIFSQCSRAVALMLLRRREMSSRREKMPRINVS